MSELTLAKRIIRILDVKCRKGLKNPSWYGFENGAGDECGIDIEELIRHSRKIIKKHEKTYQRPEKR